MTKQSAWHSTRPSCATSYLTVLTPRRNDPTTQIKVPSPSNITKSSASTPPSLLRHKFNSIPQTPSTSSFFLLRFPFQVRCWGSFIN
ncbi:hypothetical protein L2E82_49052 [Cichorium intybus]|uniref:Uncharacterized protein n=1 Tax=Cichorium intybus TaxID=13427 RepID=A0ACB8Z062_CICIN|nr:hypothetical protein L2E82_49052 [Cichorium intybus]